MKFDEREEMSRADPASSLDANGPIGIHDFRMGGSVPFIAKHDRGGSDNLGKKTPRLDEYEVDFSDTRQFCVARYADIVKAATDGLSISDLEIASKYPDWQDLAGEIQARLTNTLPSPFTRRQMVRIQPLPHALASFTRLFANLMHPEEVNFELIWGLISLNLKLSYLSAERLKRTCEVLHKIRRLAELFTRCLENCDEANEARIAAVDFLDPLVIILTDSITYLHQCSSDLDAEQAWPDLNDDINIQLSAMDSTVKHVNDITIHSKVNLDRQIRNLTQRHALVPEPEETGKFPNRILPFQQNAKFYGRKEELEKIYKYLNPRGDGAYKTYTIYGRRGVGKTEIALQFAYTNPCGFDAVFWIQCETSVAIRQSFTDVAVSLELPGADRDGHHEENLLMVKQWLKRTKRRWLLIFDNAENTQILSPYWPTGASGSILLTSRRYFNFSQDLKRKGDTVKPFDDEQSWELLLELLGGDWKQMDREGKIVPSEVAAAKDLLSRLEGLALAIQQAAILIKDSVVGGPKISKTLELFKERIRNLPERYSVPRSTAEFALDALWDMSFSMLSGNARTLLGVLAWLSPDKIPVDLFLPKIQSTLDGPLEFCKQDAKLYEEGNPLLYTVISPSPALDKSIQELLDRVLIKQDNRNLAVHRVVQEATNYQNLDDLQSSFDAAVRLVAYQFPKRGMDENMFAKWSQCQEYVAHAVHLSKKFSDHIRSGVLKGSNVLVVLLSDCAWYLHEVGDYNVSGRVLDTGMLACEEKESLLYADLQNTAGSRYFDLNQLANCRKAWDNALRIRKSYLPHSSPGIAALYNNLGNAELATGNLEDAMDYFNRAIPIWKKWGDEQATWLALTYLCVGRAHTIRRGDFGEAMKWTSQADALFMRTIGADRGFMVNVHYAYGNIHYRQKNYALAQRDYEACLKLCLATMPIHLITAAAYYSLACVEFDLKNIDAAKSLLHKARSIAELRSPNRDDGSIARILWKTAVVLESDTYGKFVEEAERLRTRAAVAQQQLIVAGEGGGVPEISEYTERDLEEDSYDALVPLFFR